MPGLPLSILPLQPHDTARIAALWLRSTIRGHPFLPPSYWEARLEEVVRVWLPAARTWVAWSRGEPVGFVSLVGGEHIGALFVESAHEGRGVGRALIERCKADHAVLTLEVYAANRRAVAFYRRCGFRITDRRRDADSGAAAYGMRYEAAPPVAGSRDGNDRSPSDSV